MTCQICSSTKSLAPQGVCGPCSISSARALSDVVSLSRDLRKKLTPEISERVGARSMPASKPPLAIHVVSLLGPDSPEGDPRNEMDQGGSLSILTVLSRWRRAMIAARGQYWKASPATPGIWAVAVNGDIEYSAHWLRGQWHWAERELPGFAEFCQELIELRKAIQTAITPGPTARRVGRCPVRGENQVRCNEQLMVFPEAESLRCKGCGTEWTRANWRELGRLIEEANNATNSNEQNPATSTVLSVDTTTVHRAN